MEETEYQHAIYTTVSMRALHHTQTVSYPAVDEGLVEQQHRLLTHTLFQPTSFCLSVELDTPTNDHVSKY